MADWNAVVEAYEAKIAVLVKQVESAWQTHHVAGAAVAGVLAGILIGVIL